MLAENDDPARCITVGFGSSHEQPDLIPTHGKASYRFAGDDGSAQSTPSFCPSSMGDTDNVLTDNLTVALWSTSGLYLAHIFGGSIQAIDLFHMNLLHVDVNMK